ncbi:AAA family ATPase [Streptomyces scopuliridis]|uniref:AAA family ATPase n=1 Tax=Streptomyces scopuliridis TaxID=452529 RepID=UPI002DDC444C|nr:AAA family ATPase [Streptomyces scopuliridis]WSB34452.1 AAA family ATPase [Streptomyces scopuliridis]
MADDIPSPALLLRDLLLSRLDGSGLDPEARDVLRELLPGAQAGGAGRTGPVYLRSITAAGWRGIGPSSTLELRPGPGLTLVAGRNGSGKSSFAEAAEMALTGDNARWHKRPQIWQQSWRNLHEHTAPEVSVELALGAGGDVATVRRGWHGDQLADCRTVVERPGLPVQPLSEVIDPGELSLYRPFLSYSELGAMIQGPLSGLHDVFFRILGLELLRDTDKKALALGKALNEMVAKAAELSGSLAGELSALGDPQAAEAAAAIGGPRPDLDRVRGLLASRGATDDGELARLRRLVGLERPGRPAVEAAAARLRAAAADAEDARFSSAEDARQLADLLGAALEHRRRHPETSDCPVCGSADRLDRAWAERAREQVERLQSEAAEAQAARRELAAARRALQDLVRPVPDWLQRDLPSLAGLWRDWFACRGVSEPRELADRAERSTADLDNACHQVSEDAAKRLADLDGRWQVMAGRLAEWLRHAEAAEAAQSRIKHAKAVRAWLRKVTDELRDERLRPFAGKSQGVWQLLSERSSVSLGSISLAGTANQGTVVLDVSVDDIDAPAFSVMSQGELHSLALSLFIPRATHDDSPFSFLVIDDPVQSMDPEKVEGLAKVLDLYAKTRQVVVFTHDTRLRRAIEHLNIPATVMEVSRQTDSVVRVEKSADPVGQAIKNARDLARDPGLPQEVADRVLPAMCRVALEAAYLESARRRLRGRWDELLVLEGKIDKARRLVEVARLVHYPGTRIEDVPAAVAQEHGEWARTVMRQCNTGSHQELPPVVERLDLVNRTERLAKAVQAR